ncbi:ATP-binding protein [Enterococcus faecium]|nr:ATP-binding protein [Enterococcus faecium]
MSKKSEEVIYYQGAHRIEKSLDEVQKVISQALQMENLSILMGAGCSSFFIEDKEAAISTMAGLFSDFVSLHPDFKILGVDIQDKVNSNLEELMDFMNALRQVNHIKEYEKAFSKIEEDNNEIKCQFIKPLSSAEKIEIPVWLLSVDDWAILLSASEKTQIPILRKTIEVVKVFFSDSSDSERIKNHILSSTIIGLLNSSDSSPSKSDKVSSLLLNFRTKNINLDTPIEGNKTLRESISVSYGKINDVETIISFLQEYIEPSLMEEIRTIGEVHFSSEDFLKAMKFAILYEGSLNSQKVQEYTAPLVARMQSLVDSSFSRIFTKTEFPDRDTFFENLLDENNIINIDVSSMDDSMAEVLIRVLSKIILDYQKKYVQKADKPINLLIEEAHRYIKDSPYSQGSYDFDIFQRIAKEGRKYGLLMCVSTQRPSDLSKTVVSQCSNFIVHRIQNPDDLSYISSMVPYIDKDTINRLTYLQTGHALVFGSSIRIPMLTAFEEAIPNTDGNSARISEKWYIESRDKNRSI